VLGHGALAPAGLHHRGHLLHPWFAGEAGAAAKGFRRARVIATLPVDVRELLVQVPLGRVRGDAALHERDGGVRVHRRQDHGRELVGADELRVEPGDELEQPREHDGIDGADAV
jgi:hypothetical protein